MNAGRQPIVYPNVSYLTYNVSGAYVYGTHTYVHIYLSYGLSAGIVEWVAARNRTGAANYAICPKNKEKKHI